MAKLERERKAVAADRARVQSAQVALSQDRRDLDEARAQFDDEHPDGVTLRSGTSLGGLIEDEDEEEG